MAMRSFVSKWATDRNIPFHSVRFETVLYAEKHGVSTQMAARDLRYKWFEEIRADNGYDYIALAHNLNDSIETFLLNLTRGTGIAGLSGIKPLSGRLVRPMLPFTRMEINSYKDEYEVPFREDSSNAETKYTRNNIRHNIIPRLKEINPSFDQTLSATIGILTDIGEIFFEHVEKLRKKYLKSAGDGYRIKISDLNKLFGNKAVAFEFFRSFGINRSQMDDIISISGGEPGRMVITSEYRILADREYLIIEKADSNVINPIVVNDSSQLIYLPFIENIETSENHGGFVPPENNKGASFDVDKIRFPIIFRGWEKGDWFYPLGMKGKKKLSDFFIDNKLSISDKEKVRIMEVDGSIAWIVGHRIDERFRVTDQTRKILTLTLRVKSQ